MVLFTSRRVLSCGLALCWASGGLSVAGALNVRVLVLAAPQMTVKLPAAAQTVVRPAGLAPSTPTAPTPVTASTWKVGVMGSGAGAHLTLNGQDSGNNTLYLPPSDGSQITVGNSTYRGGLLLRVQQGGVQAINVVGVDDYVRGVVASEMPASWPSSALAAQAIIARTYVAARINPAQPYDTCATESCQVYGGISAEKPQTDAAVAATAGQVVAYGSKPASTYFSSDSGGFTASAQEVWGMNGLPYLPAQPDPFSAGGPKSTWTLSVPLSKVQNAAAGYGVRVGALKSVSVTKVSPSGRPQEITFVGASGSAKLGGAEAGGFVRSLGAGSSRAALSGLDPLTITGSGQGHGVGLSQYGALGLARKGYDHLHILGFYYPGTVLSMLAGSGAGGPVLAQQAEQPRHADAPTAPSAYDLLAGTPLGWTGE